MKCIDNDLIACRGRKISFFLRGPWKKLRSTERASSRVLLSCKPLLVYIYIYVYRYIYSGALESLGGNSSRVGI